MSQMLPLKEKINDPRLKHYSVCAHMQTWIWHRKRSSEMWGSSSGLQHLPVFPSSTSWAAKSSQCPNPHSVQQLRVLPQQILLSIPCLYTSASVPALCHLLARLPPAPSGFHQPLEGLILRELPRVIHSISGCWGGCNTPTA